MERNGLRAASEGNEFDRLSWREDIVAALVEVVGDGEDDMVTFVFLEQGSGTFLVASRDRLENKDYNSFT